ncbi:hypothetical protein K7X08_030901 [Anisodus acutangulus]|uniref:Uncharacterized protein n=1 Tax=Anisodus acutangulus TaxID=402998 RepID=A0A9Q1M193_9SOLA|nr:hypothetical protein K7X08_030901 [Anisodus acutangulus]
MPKVFSSRTIVTYPGNNDKGKRISDGEYGVIKGKRNINAKDKESIVPTKRVTTQNNFDLLGNITEDEIVNEGNTTTTCDMSKVVVDNKKEIENEVVTTEIQADKVHMVDHKDIDEWIDVDQQHVDSTSHVIHMKEGQLGVSINDKGIGSFPPEIEAVTDVSVNQVEIGSHPRQLFLGDNGGTLVVREEGEPLAVFFPKAISPNKVLHDLISHNIEINVEEEAT